MKTTALSFSLALCAVLNLPLPSAKAADYKTTVTGIGATANQNWNALTWVPTVTGSPGAGDTVTDITGSKTYYLYLNADRTLAELRKTTDTNIHLYNGTVDEGDDAESHTFTIGTLNIERGGYIFRSQGTGSLTVNVDHVHAGDANSLATAASLSIGNSTSGANVNFSTQRLDLYQRATVSISYTGNSYPTVDLGHIVFHNDTPSSTSQLILGQSGATNLSLRVKAASLSTALVPSGDTNLIKGSGVLELTGNLDDLDYPGGSSGIASFEGRIQDTIRLEKTGSGIQILSRTGSNTYSGGTLISNGVLGIRSTANSALGTGEVLITGQGTLAGSGLVRPSAGKEIVVGAGGRLAPSADLSTTAQTLRFSGTNHTSSTLLRAEEEARFAFQLFENDNDQIAFLNYTEGNFLIDAPGGVFIDISGEIKSGVYTLLTFHTGDENSGLKSSGLTGGLQLGEGFDGYTATFHYDEALYGGIGTISLEIQAIPEPANLALLFLGAGAAWAFTRRKRRASL